MRPFIQFIKAKNNLLATLNVHKHWSPRTWTVKVRSDQCVIEAHCTNIIRRYVSILTIINSIRYDRNQSFCILNSNKLKQEKWFFFCITNWVSDQLFGRVEKTNVQTSRALIAPEIIIIIRLPPNICSTNWLAVNICRSYYIVRQWSDI